MARMSAVFFVIGERLSRPSGMRLAKRIVAEGHLLGNHSYSHARLAGMSTATVRRELGRTQELIEAAGERRRLFRPPYGATDASLDEISTKLGYGMLLWNVDSLDWRLRAQGTWLTHVKDQIGRSPLQTVLLHDIHITTAQGLATLLTYLSDAQDVTVAPADEWQEYAVRLGVGSWDCIPR